MKDVVICKFCNKPKPSLNCTPFSDECDSGYTVLLDDGTRYPGYCDSIRAGFPWPPPECKKDKEES